MPSFVSGNEAAAAPPAVSLMASRVRDALPYIVVLAISVALFIHGEDIESIMGGEGRLGPAFWPRLILVLASLVCVFEIFFRLFFNMPGTAGLLSQITQKMEGEEGHVEEAVDKTSPLRLALGVGLCLAYVASMTRLGFPLATFLFIGAFLWLGGFRRPVAAGVTSLVGAVALTFLFMKVVYVSLPLGTGIFGQLSVALLPLLGIR